MQKRGFSGGVSATAPMIKSIKGWRKKKKKEVNAVGVAYLSLVESLFVLYSNFSLIIGKNNLMIFVIKSLFSYQWLILLY